jgi:hypothetical protein
MKKIVLLLLFLTSVLGFSQDTFQITNEEGVNKYVVVEIAGKYKKELYAKTINWLNSEFDTSKCKIEGVIENEMVKFQIAETNYIYLFKVDFKDGKYRLECLKFVIASSLGKMAYSLSTKNILNKRGEVKTGQGYIDRATKDLNKYNTSLKVFLETENEAKW